jgi:hypothetical protein
VSEPMGAGEGDDEVEDRRIKSKARTVAAARHAFRKVHMVGGHQAARGRYERELATGNMKWLEGTAVCLGLTLWRAMHPLRLRLGYVSLCGCGND